MLYVFSTVWVACFILFPAWYLPVKPGFRLLAFTAFLIYFLVNYCIISKWIKPENRISVINEFKPLKKAGWLLFICILSAIVHIRPMMYPINRLSDELYHAYLSIAPVKVIENSMGVSLVPICWLLFIVGVYLWKKEVHKTLAKHKFAAITAGAGLCYFYYYLVSAAGPFDFTKHLSFLFRFPPLGRIINMVFYCLFGTNEFAGRLPSFLFSLLSVIYLYKLTGLYRDKQTSNLAGLILMFTPIFFYHSRLVLFDAGAVFFYIGSSFYFLRYTQQKNYTDAIVSACLIGAGALYKRVLVLMLFIIVFYLFIFKRDELLNNLRGYAKLCWISLVPIIPWLIFSYSLPIRRTYLPDFSNLLDLKVFSSAFRQIPESASIVILVLFLGGLLWSARKRWDDLTKFSLVWFGVYYLFITLDAAHTHRLTLPVYPVIAIFAAQFLRKIVNEKLHLKFSGIYTVMLGYLLSCCLFANLSPLLPQYTVLTDRRTAYIPYGNMVAYIKDHIPRGSRLFFLFPEDEGFPWYYLKMHHLKTECDNNWKKLNWNKVKDMKRLIEDLSEDEIDYLVCVLIGSSHKKMMKKTASLKLKNKAKFGENKIILFSIPGCRP